MTYSEDRFTADCFQLAWNKYPETRYKLFHIVNEGLRSQRTGAKFKSMGLLPGVPDFAFLWSGITHYCELKLPGGKLSDSQKKLHAEWKENGTEISICYDIDNFEKWLVNIINN